MQNLLGKIDVRDLIALGACAVVVARIIGGSTLSAMMAPTTTHAGLGTVAYSWRTGRAAAATTTRNGSVPGNVDRFGPTSTQALSQPLRTDFASVVKGWFIASAKTPSRRLAGPKYDRPSASRQFSVGSARHSGV